MPGAVIAAKGPDIALRKDRPRQKLRVTNKGDRAVQVSGSLSKMIGGTRVFVLIRDRSVHTFILLKQTLAWISTA